MKKKLMAYILAAVLIGGTSVSVSATQAEISVEETEDKTAAEEASTEETTENAGIVIPQGNMVDVNSIDLSLHSETSGDFTAVYAYENPFRGKDTSKGVVLEFYAKPTWEVHELGAIFAFNGSGEYDGKLYFSPGSYLGYNSPGFGGYYDANLFNYTIVTDYIKDGAKIRIELTPSGFAVYADDILCYDQTILEDPNKGAGDFHSDSDFSGVLTWLSGAEALYFGAGSWWNAVGSNEANIELSEVNFRLVDGTVVMDQLRADKDLVEALGGSVTGETEEAETVEIQEVEVELFDVDSVAYEAKSVMPLMIVLTVVSAVAAIVIILVALKKRNYSEI